MGRAVELKDNYLQNWPEISKFCKERTDCKVLLWLDDGVIVGIAMVSYGRVHKMIIEEECRRGGIGSSFLRYIMSTCINDAGSVRAVISQDNDAATAFFLRNGFKFIGFNSHRGDNRYLLEFKNTPTRIDLEPQSVIDTEFKDLSEKIYIIETAPIKML